MKDVLRKIALLSPLALTKNIKYDRASKQILKKVLNPNANCIDVGCHKGEFMDMMIQYAPNGSHMGFEPIPEMYESLQDKYGNHHTIYQLALSNQKGELSFQHVTNFPAYSGFKERNYDGKNAVIEQITVQTELLDSLIGEHERVDFIKIDVEGAELQVLEGAQKTINRCHPFILFEFGKGAADHYGTTAEMIYEFFKNNGMELNTLSGWLNSSRSLSLELLNNYFNKGDEYYFIAYSKD